MDVRIWVAAVLLPVGVAAEAQQAPQRTVGTVVSADAQRVVLDVGGKRTVVAMTAGWDLVSAHAASAGDIKPGDFIASANDNVADGVGRATEVRILEPGYRPENGSHPMGRPGQSMTHGTVSSVNATTGGQQMEVGFPGGSRQILVPTSVTVTGYDVVATGSAAPGTRVEAITRRGADGVDRAGRLLVAKP